jgi:hypothetical protein
LGNSNKNGTMIDDFGNTLYSSRIRYLNPKIYFQNHSKNNTSYHFEIHYVDAWGRMKYNTDSGEIPTSESNIYLYENNKVLAGWGNDDGGTWRAGKWIVEIWSNGVCLGSKKFTIY